MSRKLVTLFLSMLVLAGAMGLKAAVVRHDDGSVILRNGAAPVPTPWSNGPAPTPKPWK